MKRKVKSLCMALDDEKTYCGKDIWVHSRAWFWKYVSCKDCLHLKQTKGR